MRQYIAIRFNPWDRRAYTYHHDGEPLKPGDTVEVSTPREGPKAAPVETVIIDPPPFTTKPIVRVIARAAAAGE